MPTKRIVFTYQKQNSLIESLKSPLTFGSREKLWIKKTFVEMSEMSHFLYRFFFFLTKITFLASKDSVLEFTSYLPQFFFLLLIMVIETLDT